MAVEGYRNPHDPCSAGFPSADVRRIFLRRARDLAHQFHDIPFRIAESHHPQIVGWHRSDQTRRRHNLYTPLDKKLVRGVDILNPEVQDGARLIELRRVRGAKHQAHSAETPELDHASSILYFRVKDINAAHQLLVERRVQIVAPPRLIAPMPAYDLWMMGFRDTEGNIMELMSEVPRPS